MKTSYTVNELDEVVTYYENRKSNTTTDRRDVTDFEKQLLEEIEELEAKIEELEAKINT